MRLTRILASGLLVFMSSVVLGLAKSGRVGGARGVSGNAAPVVPATLRALAARADREQGWSPLARYAESVRDRETKGLAYFVLGYREYQARNYARASDDLGRATATSFSLGDFAAYYRAEAASGGGQPDVAAQTLASFDARFPASSLRSDAARLLASSLIDAGRAPEAIDFLQSASALRELPGFELLLAQAYQKTGNLAAAARSFEKVYYGSPNAPEAAAAGTALAALEIELGSSYVAPSDALRGARADALEKGGHFDQALVEYERVLGEHPTALWRLGRNRCLLRLGRVSEAVADVSAGGWPAGDINDERQLLLVRGKARLEDQTGMLAALAELAVASPEPPAYAAALDSVSYFFIRHGDWTHAGEYSAVLAEKFPESSLASKARWQVVWAACLGGRSAEAERGFLDYVGRYPSSPRVPSALYWLGRLAETGGRTVEARSLYTLVHSRFHNSYYSLRAGERLSSIDPGPSSGVRSLGSQAGIRTSGGREMGLPAEIESAISELAPAPDAEALCPGAPSLAAARAAFTLAALGLGSLAGRDLRERLEAPGPPREVTKLRLTLARIERDGEQYDEATLNAKRVVPNYADYDFSRLPGDVWSLLYPEAFWDLVRRNASINHLDPYLVMALIRQESGFNPKASSAAGARGLMQLLPPTARDIARERKKGRRALNGNLEDADYNLRSGCRYLSEMIQEFNGSLEQALAAYNAGPDHVKQWASHPYPEPAAFVETIPYPETRVYVEAVLRDQAVYRLLMTGRPKFRPGGPRA